MKKKQRSNKKKKRGFRSFLGLFASGVVVDSGASRLRTGSRCQYTKYTGENREEEATYELSPRLWKDN